MGRKCLLEIKCSPLSYVWLLFMPVLRLFVSIFKYLYVCAIKFVSRTYLFRADRSYGLRRRSVASWFLGPLVWFPVRAWIFVSCVSYVSCRYWPVWRTGHSFRGVLPVVCVTYKPQTKWPRPELFTSQAFIWACIQQCIDSVFLSM